MYIMQEQANNMSVLEALAFLEMLANGIIDELISYNKFDQDVYDSAVSIRRLTQALRDKSAPNKKDEWAQIHAYEPNELFVYTNGDKWELGMVKCENNTGDGYFCWYSRGDTAANTPVRCMHKLFNAGWTRVEELLDIAVLRAKVSG